VFQRRKELRHTAEDEEFKAPRWFNWPGISFISAKVFAIAAAYFFIIRFLLHAIL
jgi:hypothetical protein